jgi:hypothetical protein
VFTYFCISCCCDILSVKYMTHLTLEIYCSGDKQQLLCLWSAKYETVRSSWGGPDKPLWICSMWYWVCMLNRSTWHLLMSSVCKVGFGSSPRFFLALVLHIDSNKFICAVVLLSYCYPILSEVSYGHCDELWNELLQWHYITSTGRYYGTVPNQ